MFITDMTNCDVEPIHIPGKIQSHGFLIAIDRGFNITFCSENISTFLPTSATSLLTKPVQSLDAYLQKTGPPGFIIQLIKLGETGKGFMPANPYSIEVQGQLFNLIISDSGDHYLLNFEPEISDLNSDIHRILGSSLSIMLADSQLLPLLRKSVQEVQKIIGYDRVMIYKFHKDGHGEVVAEVKNEELKPFMGLHYPASDIPKQARELYKINVTRLIADVSTEPSIIITSNKFHSTPLDLTHSTLRAVSPMHIQYLKNMGVASSFSISLLHHGELWGLVACHNYSPRFINYKEREACKLIGQVLSSALSFRQAEEDEYLNNKLKMSVDALTKQLIRYSSIEEALFEHKVTLLEAVGATGAALLFDNKLHSAGDTPDEKFIAGLTDWLNETMENQLYETDRLPLVYPAALSKRKQVSGLLACRLSKEPKEFMIWFKPEVVTTINWAGNPDKPVEFGTGGIMEISPRKSFDKWSQTVECTSTAWKKEDFKSALQLKEEVAFAISRKAAEIRRLNEKLNEAYNELDAFSYTISHDLKNPLTSIKSYSEILTEFFSLEPKAQSMVDGILKSANKMQKMIEEVLNYSRMGQARIKPKAVDMDKILNEIRKELLIVNQKPRLQITIGNTPDLFGDETMLMQVFSNLISNAVKYSGETYESSVTINGEDTGKAIQYTVTDNGIGIKAADHERIFELFTRSDEVKDYEGSGVGLSIVKKIMEKHRGKIWLKSEVNAGSTFYVSFNKYENPPALN